jgi:hypothetical protein
MISILFRSQGSTRTAQCVIENGSYLLNHVYFFPPQIFVFMDEVNKKNSFF